MHADKATLKHAKLTEQILGAAYRVHNALGYGFAEKVYENALVHELGKAGLDIKQQWPVAVRYDGEVVGDYVADLVVCGRVVVEVKAVSRLEPAPEVQLVNYLKATGIEVGLLINFGRKVEFKRRVFEQ
jgi:GxxExxY protein